MGTPGKNSSSGITQGLTLLTGLGMSVGIPMALGALLGDYLDERYGGGRGLLFTVVFLLGIGSGLYNGYRLLRRAAESTK